jgi:hypothetical protein
MHHAAFWSIAEPAVAIMNCCIATLRPLLKLISPSRLRSSNKGEMKDFVGYSGGLSARKASRPTHGFEHDEYPLTRIEEAMSTTSVTTNNESGGKVRTTEAGTGDVGSSWGAHRWEHPSLPPLTRIERDTASITKCITILHFSACIVRREVLSLISEQYRKTQDPCVLLSWWVPQLVDILRQPAVRQPFEQRCERNLKLDSRKRLSLTSMWSVAECKHVLKIALPMNVKRLGIRLVVVQPVAIPGLHGADRAGILFDLLVSYANASSDARRLFKALTVLNLRSSLTTAEPASHLF